MSTRENGGGFGSCPSRCMLWKGSAVVALVAAMVVAAMGAENAERGDSPYAPTKGEWLCMSLNVQQALTGENGDTGDISVSYAYSPAKPDTITVVVRYPANLVTMEAIRAQTASAEQQVKAAAKLKGWDSWVKIETSVTEI